MVEAADYLVKNWIVHCNLIPDNVIIISESPDKVEIKICGFGSARRVETIKSKKWKMKSVTKYIAG